jgi:serine/threonine protein kinase
MELLSGGLLVPQLYRGNERRVCVEVLGPLCEAVSKMHNRGVLHLDLKPANLMWSNDWKLMVCSFGFSLLWR